MTLFLNFFYIYKTNLNEAGRRDIVELKNKILDESRIDTLSRTGKPIVLNITRLARRGKKAIKDVIGEVLKKYSAEDMEDMIFSTLMEVVFNAIKANYRHILIRDEIAKYLITKESVKNPSERLKEIISDSDLLDEYESKIDQGKIQKKLREVLKKEEEISKIIEEHEQGEKKSYSFEERKKLRENLNMQRRANKLGIKVMVFVSVIDDKLVIDVINTVPISDKGLKKIQSKRELFRKYYEEGREQDFYIENLDETESAGFGSAMVDAHFLHKGLEPDKSFFIWKIGNKTIATLVFPLKNSKN